MKGENRMTINVSRYAELDMAAYHCEERLC